MKAPLVNLQPGDIISYRYKGDWDYSRWNGDGTHTPVGRLHGPPPEGTKQFVRGVWKKEVFHPRRIVTVK